MMSCLSCRNLLSDLIDEKLVPRLEDELVSHLRSCGDCRLYQKKFESGVDSIRLTARDFLTSFTDEQNRLVSLLEGKSTFRWGKWAGVSGGALALVLATLFYFRPDLFLGKRTFEGRFHIYSPLKYGAMEIIDEQANWIGLSESSLLEEGESSDVEFEEP